MSREFRTFPLYRVHILNRVSANRLKENYNQSFNMSNFYINLAYEKCLAVLCYFFIEGLKQHRCFQSTMLSNLKNWLKTGVQTAGFGLELFLGIYEGGIGCCLCGGPQQFCYAVRFASSLAWLA